MPTPNNKPVIVIMAGGTGGHVFPALSTAEILRAAGFQIHWLGTARGIEAKLVPAAGIDISYLSIRGVRGKGVVGWLTAPFKVMRAVHESIAVLKSLNPVCVLGMGGFAAAPGGMAARWLNIPLVIHEQNAIAGSTNRLLSLMATRVLQAFEGAFAGKNKGEVVGNPIRSAIESVRSQREHASDSEIKHILILGGSQGALALNGIVPGALREVSKEFTLAIRHQTGERGYDDVVRNYSDLPEAEVVAFINDMAAAYAWADVVICRSGALTVSEVAAAGLPCILVPFPHAIDDHQTANANILVDAGAAVLMPQDHMSEKTLSKVLADLIRPPSKLPKMSDCARSVAVLGSAEKVAQVCMEVAREY
ncbi:MAG TPA: undecaprenyldiphospho-muramoylpentapeptide beta-N-acetylglucosaminyltransferase [Pseudomonadales bacterium]|nr:undecaprenyldiphospho-muramoylpentapeptide beta-N-acetylglucosaminyltransferase [Pseudomonadales bacterium]